MNFKEQYKEKITIIDLFISNYLSTYKKASPLIIDAMKYSVLNGGKRLRSILCTEVCSMLGGDINRSMPFACGIELIHAYSLVHDDLPAMDNADLRRGQKSCHKKYGEAMAILCGDALLNCAYELMSANCKDEFDIKAMNVLASSAGAEGMISGQVKDLNSSSMNKIEEKELIDIIEQKTMAIIKSSVLAGAYIAKSDEETLKDMSDFAYNIGLAFQIRDDFEDINEDMDSSNGSPNFINALGINKAKEKLEYHFSLSKKIILKYSNNNFILELLSFLFE